MSSEPVGQGDGTTTSLSAALAADDADAVSRALLAATVLLPLQRRKDGSLVPHLLETGGAPGTALPGFSSESVLRAELDGGIDWVAIEGQRWAALARTNGLAGVLDPGSGSYVLNQQMIDQLADGLVPAIGHEPARVAADVRRQIRLPQAAEATVIAKAVARAGVEAAVVDLARNEFYRLTVVVLRGEPAAAVGAVRSLGLAQGVDIVEADDALRQWLTQHGQQTVNPRA